MNIIGFLIALAILSIFGILGWWKSRMTDYEQNIFEIIGSIICIAIFVIFIAFNL